MNKKIPKEFFNQLCKQYNIFVDDKKSLYVPISKRIFDEMFLEAYQTGFSDGIYEAQDKIDALLEELQP